MPLATEQNVIDLGFSAKQFGDPADFSAADTGYVALVLKDQALEVESEVGSGVYASAKANGTLEEKLLFKRIKNAEVYLSAAELWRRVEQYEREATVSGRSETGAETIGSRALKDAEKAEDKAWQEISLITGRSRIASFSGGVIESGHFDSVVT